MGLWSTFEKTFVQTSGVNIQPKLRILQVSDSSCSAREPEEKALPQQNTSRRKERYILSS
jgi:hypothetical protein